MADRRLAVEIVVEGDAVRIFKEIGQAAKTSAQDMESSSRRAKSGLDQMDRAAETTEQSMRELDTTQQRVTRSAADVATQSARTSRSLENYRDAVNRSQQGLAALGASFTIYSNQARNHEIALLSLERTYGTASASFVAFAEQMQSTTIFSNDQVIEAANVMGTLQRNYGLTTDQIKRLISVSGDLASLNGITLVDASQRVAAAIRGEAESAELLGLTMNQAAIDQDNLTLSMTNAEAGAFRFNALMEQSEFAVGAAGDAANTTTGQVQQLANQTQDAALALVDFTGPIGDAAAGLGSFGLEAGLAVGGLVRLGQGVKSFRAAAGGAGLFSSLATVIGSSGATVGLAGAITAAGAAALIAAPAIVTLGGAVAYLALTQDDLMDSIDAQTDALTRWANSLGKGGEAYQELLYFAQDIRDMTTTVQEMDPFGPSLTGADTTLNSVLDELLQLTPETFRQLEAALLESGIAIGNLNNLTSDQLQLVYQLVLSAWAQQTEAAIAQATAIEQSTQAWMDYEQAQNQAAIATVNAAAAMEEQNRVMQALAASQRGQGLWSGAEPMAADVVDVGPWAMRFASMGQAIADLSALTAEGIVVQYDFVEAVLASMPAMSDYYSKYLELTPAIDQASRATADFAAVQAVHSQFLGDTKGDLVELEDAYRDIADAVRESMSSMNPATVLDSTFGGVVGAAQNFARLSESVWDWSNSLTEGNKESSTLNQLFRDGLISGKTYRDGLEANHRIMLANNSVQEDALRIQAKQLPLMAQLAEEHARYVDSLADRSAEEQVVALGFMDQAKAAQALQLAQLAAASSSDAMQASTTAMIAEIAAADPQLKAMLISMGLISETETGIEVNFGEVDSATTALNTLNSTLTTFTEVIAEAFGINVKMTDNDVEGRLSRMLALLNAMDGRSITTYVNTFDIGGGSLVNAGRAATGTFILPDSQRNIAARVEGMATGGHLRLVGEAGPELVSLPTGSTVTNAAGTRGRLDPMGRRRGSQGASVVYKGNVIHQTITVEESALADRTRRVMSKRRMG